MDVELIRWPAEADKRARLAHQGKARLLLVSAGAPPPVAEDALEDWVRLPADRTEVRARAQALTLRLSAKQSEVPALHDTGILTFRDNIVHLPPTEARLVTVLADAFDSVIAPDTLIAAAWPDEVTPRNTLDVHISRIRRRLTGTGLRIRTVRSRGYMLETVPDEVART